MEVPPPGREGFCRIEVWPSEPGTGTPLIWYVDNGILWAYFGTQHPRAFSRGVLSLSWLQRLFADPRLARELSGVFALFAVNNRSREALAVADRLGVQSVYWGTDSAGTQHISTHLLRLMLATGHDGTVNRSGFLAHMGFGYPVDPYTEVYHGVRKLPPSSYLLFADGRLQRGVYWSAPAPSPKQGKGGIPNMVGALRAAMEGGVAEEGIFLGLTAGRDSLCLASMLPAESRPLTGTFGVPGCADQVRAEQISAELKWPHVSGTVCSPEEFSEWATYVAYQSAGLATASYADMTAFVARHVPRGRAFVMGEGGECLRDFFQTDGRQPLDTLQQDYMTHREYLRRTLAPELARDLGEYPGSLLRSVRASIRETDDELFALSFYRFQRMPGTFSLRHSVLGSLRAKLSPFLDTNFMNSAYRLKRDWHGGSRLHRTLIAHARPGLISYFDPPAETLPPTQDWPTRFGGRLGEVVYNLMEELLTLCDDVFHADGVRQLCRETQERPSRAIYHLLRILSFALGRSLLKERTRNGFSAIERMNPVSLPTAEVM